MINLGENCNLNIEKLIATRLLINANSGGGKSWAIRRFLEKSNGQVQQIILDLEGEFISLREKYDYLLVGKEGEIPVSIRTAELLARKLLELNVSTIIDLSELKHPERITFVKRFLDSLINSPKNLWHPAIIVVDEAHQFCPEKSKSESMSSVIDLMTRGRKRGFCGVLATQRISKLHKDAAAECNNYMVGRTGLDIDMKRAGEILGYTTKEQIRSLRSKKAGEFCGYGPAFEHDGIRDFMVGEVKTTHPDRTRGIEAMESSPTPENIKKIMKDVVDLPKEAEEELRTTKEMKNKIRELKTKLTISENSQKVQEKIQEKIINITDEKALQRAKDEGYKEAERFYKAYITPIEQNTKVLKNSINKLINNAQGLLDSKAFNIVGDFPISNPSQVNVRSKLKNETKNIAQVIPLVKPELTIISDEGEKPLKSGAVKMLGWLAGAYPGGLSKYRLAALSGFSVNGGTFKGYISAIRKKGFLVGSEELIITQEGLNNVTPLEIPSGEQLLNLWKGKFKSGVGKMLQYLYEMHPNEITKEDLGNATGFESSGGTFKGYLSTLNKNGLIEVNGGVKISDEFFE